MDFHALPRRNLQALCKRNAIRANMSNAAMADALRSLQSVEGIDEIRTAAPPGLSVLKPVADEVAREEHKHRCPLPRAGRFKSRVATKMVADQTEEAALTSDTLQTSPLTTVARDATASVDTEAVSAGKRRTRKTRRSKAKIVPDQKEEVAAAQTEPTESMLFEKKSAVVEEQHNGYPLPRGGPGRATRSRAAGYRTEDVTPAPDTLQRILRTTREAAVPLEMKVVSTGKRRMRKPRRLKVKVALDKEDEQQESIACTEMKAIGPAIISEKRCDSKGESVMDEEATKPQEGEMHYQHPSTYSGKRWTMRSRKHEMKMDLDKKEEVAAARKELIDKTCDDCDEKVSMVEVGTTSYKEGLVDELEPTSTVQKSLSSVTMKDSPMHRVLSMAESRGPVIEVAQYASVRRDGSFAESPVDEMTYKINPDTENREDHFSVSGEVDQSNLLVNTLDRYVKPMYKFAVKEEKKQGECWWMLM